MPGPHLYPDVGRLAARLFDRLQNVTNPDLLGIFKQTLTKIKKAESLHVPTTFRASESVARQHD